MDGKLYAIRGSRKYDLTTHGIAAPRDIDGMGLPGVNRISEHGPLQDGVSDIGFRLPPRNLTMVLVFAPHCFRNSRAKREAFAEIFKPSDDAIKLLLRYPDGAQRALDVHYTGGASFPTGEMTNGPIVSIRVPLTLYAPDPTWYDPGGQSTSFVLESLSELTFPATFPIFFGGGIISDYIAVNYPGTWQDYPTIVFTGPLVVPQIQNITTDELLKLEYTIAAGEVVTIVTAYGFKTVTNNFGVNLNDKLSSDSDLATFHIEAKPKAPLGVNQLYATAGGAVAGQSSITVNWTARYISG